MGAMRRTKIVATLGPASQTPEVLGAMLDAGVNVVRLNFSHGTPDQHASRLAAARGAAASRGLPLAVLVDLPGPKLRVGSLPGGRVVLDDGQEVMLVAGERGADGAIPVAYPHLAQDVRPGDRIFLQDGELALVVGAVLPPRVRCTVTCGGVLREQAGVNLPGVRLSVPATSDEDLRCLAWAVQHHVDYVGLSFVASAADIERVRAVLAAQGSPCRLVAKIERRLALDEIAAVVAAADAVMVARGDLAVETSVEEVPVVQKRIIALCNRLGRPVITATQMLESMVEHRRPTRAEAADVANAVLDGSDALMLSGETAIGAHPVEAVATMAAIAEHAEGALPYDQVLAARLTEHAGDTSEAIAVAAVEAAQTIGAAAIVAATETGSTARRVARLRPRQPVVAVTHVERTWRELALVWGVRPVLVEQVSDLDLLVAQGVRAARALGLADPGDRVVVTAGVPIGQPGTTNFLKVIAVD
jgi:pyruvate kinase